MIDRCLDKLTPRIVRRWAARVLLFAAPLSAGAFLARVTGVIPADRPDPMLFIWVYVGLLFTTSAAVVVAALATCHMATATAFGHGLRIGQGVVPPAPVEPVRRSLHVVE